MTDPPPLEKRVALVTGASQGLGAVLATLLGREGYDLIITARRRDRLEGRAKALEAEGVTVEALAGDVSDEAHRRALVGAVERLGRLDLLVNNASELGPSPLSRLAEYPLETLRRVYEVNVLAPLALVRLLLPLVQRSSGLIVNISSDAARGGYEGWGGYGSSKAALDLISKTLAGEIRDLGVGVVSVDPGDMRTEMHQRAYPGEDISDRPLPDATLPFWIWLLGQDPLEISGQRFEAQSEKWEVVHEVL